jgi:hypothetical protein
MALLNQDGLVKAAADLEAGRPVDVAPILEGTVRAAEERGVQVGPAREISRMIKSDHPHGWSGPERDIVPVEIEPYAPGSPIPEGDAPRAIGSILVHAPDGTLNVKDTRKAIQRSFNSILESWGLEAAPLTHNRAGSRKSLPAHEQTGWIAEIGKSDLGEINSHARNEADFIALEKLPELWRTSAYKETVDWLEIKKRGWAKNFYKAVHKFENELKIGKDHYKVDIFVKETADGKHYYYQELTKKNPSSIQGDTPPQGGGRQVPINSGSGENIAQAGGPVNGLAPERQPVSFERAGPDRVEVDAKALAEDTARVRERAAAGPEVEAATLEAEMNHLTAKIEELHQQGKLSDDYLAALEAAAVDVDKARQQKTALEVGAECVIAHLGDFK